MKKLLFLVSLLIFFVVANATHKRDENAPFIILRMMNTSSEDFAYMKDLTNLLKKYPNTFNEVWLCTKAYFPSLKATEDDSKNYITKVSKLWSDIGIRPSYQIGTTLGHGNKNLNEHGFSKEAFRLNFKGERINSLCSNPPEVRDYFYKRTLTLINNTPLESIWLDDDFRISNKFDDICFCKLCLDRFNAEQKSNWSVDDLSKALFSNNHKYASLRKAWIKSHEKSLCELAEIVAKARDDASRNCVLGLQSINPRGYNCHDFPSLISAFAKDKKAGLRIGSGAYNEFNDVVLFSKMLGVMYETDRCLKAKNFYQICYELENYPHIAMQKTPRAMMLECALMLASGCDSIALYWDCDQYFEPWSSYEQFAKVVKEYRPFLEQVGNFYKDTRLWGVGKYIGETMYAEITERGEKKYKYIGSYVDNKELDIMNSGVPVISNNSYADIVLLTKDVVAKLSNKEIEKVLSKNCIIESDTLILLNQRGFEFGVKAKTFNAGEIFGGSCIERHKGVVFAMAPYITFYNLEVSNKNAKIISDVIEQPNKKIGSAFAVVDTKFGGKVFVVGGNGILKYHSAFRRSAFLDALDILSPMPVRLETSHSMVFIPRVDNNGEFANGLIYNFTKGNTQELVLRIRSSVAKKYKLIRPMQADVVVESTKASDGDGYILKLPALSPVSVCAIQVIK